ncbi:signal peptidase I [uncultured Thermanaerothrix sp.]|uniref:signal peptidase I n=1 Tax=uncultured Thermanaerothrix sp. TaxID=1195149 RepID=UPI00260EA3F8|nr:signal peptidase I [uncultured Thermanaerothrix sp.]
MRKSFHHRLLTFLSAPRTHRAAWWVLALSAVAAYLLIYLLAPTLAPGINFYLVQPLAWLLLGGVAALLAWSGWSAWPRPTRLLFMFALLLGLIQTAAFLLAGIIFGLGYSPYAHRFPAVVGNLWYLAAGLFGLETARATFVRRVGQHNLLLAVALGALIPTLLLIPLARWTTLDTPPEIIAFLGAHLLPGLAEGLVAALLAWLGGPLPAILYRALPLLFEWLSPVLPNLTWLVHAFIGTLVPLIGFFYLQGFLPTTANPDTAAEAPSSHHSRSLNSWWWALLIALTVFWFNTGFFGVRPFVVSGYSMKPTLVAGDLVIVQPVTPEAVRVGDIIQFRLPGGSVVHRVVEIHRENNQLTFITQGDNNNVRDDPITPEQVQGRVVLVIPKVGWPTLWLKQVVQWLF